MAKEKKRFSLRSFTTFSLVISTIIMSWSGFILYVAPPGRIANWGTWKLMLFTKAEWQALHTIFSYLFFILFVIHLFFVNWKTFLTYFRSRISAGLNKRWELAAAIVLSGVIFTGTLRSWTPFGPVMKFGEKIKEGWGSKFETPPVIHMENYTLIQLSYLFDSIPVHEIVQTLDDKKVKLRDGDTTLRQISERNNLTPAEVYKIIADKHGEMSDHSPKQGVSGQGFGKYTLKMVADESGRDLSVLIQRLKEKGIDAGGETSLRMIADRLGTTPREAYNYLTAE